MDQKEFFQKCAALVEQGYAIINLNLHTGEITIVPVDFEKFPNNALTTEELAACAKGKIEGIKKVRELRNMGLAEAKAFVEKLYNFPAPVY